MKIFSRVVILFLFFLNISLHAQEHIPFSTNSDHITIWNGEEYVPFFIKGMNLGISVPGTFPGELNATEEQYMRWFTLIKDAGYNCIRLYTLHYPHFYSVLQEYNNLHRENPLFFFQGVWLNEEHEGYNGDLFFMRDTFFIEIEENIDALHGSRTIPMRYGKAFGTYTADVSEWNMGYIIGREVYPEEILVTNEFHRDISSFQGTHFSIADASASEVFFTSALNHLVGYEREHFATEKPVAISSWPTLDPLSHIEEPSRGEDTVGVDLSKITVTDAPAGLFISYHAYPYYPDFVSNQTSYSNTDDGLGPNSYLGYLLELKSHYENMPLIVAEFGVPSSWGIAHYASSGMNHGGFSESEQGYTNIRLFHSIEDAGCGGGMQFAWMDEWFKRTWVTDPVDYIAQQRVLWHNITAAEQNYGLITFNDTRPFSAVLFEAEDDEVQKIEARASYEAFEMKLALKAPMGIPDEMWIAIDSYSDSLGETILPSGDTLIQRSEFVIRITNYSATLYVTEAYDLFGLWHNQLQDDQELHSTATIGKPWKIVRWKNNSGYEDVQYVGNLKVNYDFQPPSSLDAIRISNQEISVKIPWSYLNFVAPAERRVFHDNRNTMVVEDTISEGIKCTVVYHANKYSFNNRFEWENWNTIEEGTTQETLKQSYSIMKEYLTDFNTSAIAIPDTFYLIYDAEHDQFPSAGSILKNDYDLDGANMHAVIMQSAHNGVVELSGEGYFNYLPLQKSNEDSFAYSVFDGYSLSEPVMVKLYLEGAVPADFKAKIANKQFLFPNPAQNLVTINVKDEPSEIYIFDSRGKNINAAFTSRTVFDVSNLPKGMYSVLLKINKEYYGEQLIID